jgi:hypothetical protein
VDDFADLDANAAAPPSPGLRARRARLRRWAFHVVAAASIATLLLAVRGTIVWLSPATKAGAAGSVTSAVAPAPLPVEPLPVVAEQTAAEQTATEPPAAAKTPPVPRAAKPAAPARVFKLGNKAGGPRSPERGKPKSPPRR